MKKSNLAFILPGLLLLFFAARLQAQTCTRPLQLNTESAAQWQGWGNGVQNQRRAHGGISSADLESLRLRWAFAFEDASSAIGNPVVHGDALFTGSESGLVYALDANTGCTHWQFKASAGVRTAPVLAFIQGRWLVFFGDRSAQVNALDALTGLLLWQTRVDSHPAAILTGGPQYFHLENNSVTDRLLIPVSSSEEGMAAIPTYNCCSFRGSVVSLDASNGRQLWKRYTIQRPSLKTSDTSAGPSGAAIWSAPTVDIARKRFYVTTGDAYSRPADIASDAVLAMDLLDGHILWVNQGTADDVWTVRCLSPDAPDDCGPDQDYGSPGILASSGNEHFLVAGQKSGIVRAFNLDDGSLHWSTTLVEHPEEFGGKIVWGGASDAEQVYFGLGSGGIAALRISDGQLQWFTEIQTDSDRTAHPGQDGPVLVSEDLLISGGWDGILRMLNSKDGQEIWRFDTVQEFTTVNGASGHGGSIGAVGQVMAGKRLYVSSGYVGVKNGMPGNILLMFSASD